MTQGNLIHGSAKVVALSGGVGGAKLVRGLSQILPPKDMTVIVNTGDDFKHLGLHVSPDIDSVLYALAGLDDPIRGWGRRDETWNFLDALKTLGGESWFQLGDKDLAVHVERSHMLSCGKSLSQATSDLAIRLGISLNILPMSNDPVATTIVTDSGLMPFQEYFVKERCKPVLRGVQYEGAAEALPAGGVCDSLRSKDMSCVIICPSNPFLSVGPILAIPEIRLVLADVTVPIIAVSPIVGGQALKGPAAKILGELGRPVNPVSIAEYYRGLVTAIVIDECDEVFKPQIEALGLVCMCTRTIMKNDRDKATLADDLIRFANELQFKEYWSADCWQMW